MTEGVLYIATGEKYIKEVSASVESLRKYMEEIPVTVLTDRSFNHPEIDEIRLLEDPEYDFSDSLVSFDDLPYDRTLLLDSDTYILSDVSELFDSLDRFDFGAAINPTPRHYESPADTYVPNEIPDCFPLVNSGVVLLKRTPEVKELLNSWEDIFYKNLDSNPKGFNQPALREALYKSNIRLFTLSPEYNCCIWLPGVLDGNAKILHGRHPRMNDVAREINRTAETRIHAPSKWPIKVESGKKPLYFRIRMSVERDGFITTAKRGLSKLFI